MREKGYNSNIRIINKEVIYMNRLKDFFKFIGEKLKRSIERFPLTLVVTAAFVVVAIMLAHADYQASHRELLERMLFAIATGIPITAMVKLAIERFEWVDGKRLVASAISLVLPVLYFFTIPVDYGRYFVMRFMALWAILFFAFLIIPYFLKREGLSRYVLHLLGKFFLTVLYAGVIFGGISMMVFTIEELFSVNWWDEVYFDVFIIIAGAFGVTHFLGSVPEIKTDVPINEFSKIFKGLFLYIVLPIVSVYTVILYAYFVKILFNFKLPEGVIGNLVLWYALVSVTTLFFIRDLRREVPWLPKFYKFYIPLMSIPLLMLFIAIFIRIDAYGMTMPRYFVVALALFSTISLVVMWLRKNDTSVVTMLLLVGFIAVSFFGPLSGYSVTLSSQTGQLEALLVENGMLDAEGKLVANASLDQDAQRAISEKTQFLLRSYELKEIGILPSDFEGDRIKAYYGFELYDYWGMPGDRSSYFNYFSKDYNRIMPLYGAEFMVTATNYEAIGRVELNDAYSIEKKLNDAMFTIYRGEETAIQIDLRRAAAVFYLNQNEDPVFESDDGAIKVTLVYQNIDGRVVGEVSPSVPDDLNVQYFEVRVLLDVE